MRDKLKRRIIRGVNSPSSCCARLEPIQPKSVYSVDTMSEFREAFNKLTTESVHKQIAREKKKDKVLIAIAVPFLAGYFAFPGTASFSSFYIKLFFIISFITLTIATFFLIWRQFRIEKRSDQYVEASKKTSSLVAKVTDDFLDKYVVPAAKYDERVQLEKLLSKAKNKEEVDKILDERLKSLQKQYEDVDKGISAPDGGDNTLLATIMTFLSVSLNNQDVLTTLKKPLNEKHSTIKYWIDYLGEKTRYILFYFSMALLFVGTLLVLVTK